MLVEGKNKIAWVLYDFANSTYHLMIPTVIMPLYFRHVLATQISQPDLAWSVIVSAPVLLAGLFSPFLGAAADCAGYRKGLLVATALGAIGFTALIPLARQGEFVLGSVLFGGSFFFFVLSLSMYDSLLRWVVPPSGSAGLSGLGWGIGYVGGLVVLAALYPLLKDAQLPHGLGKFRLAILAVAGFYLVFSLPTFFLLQPKEAPSNHGGNLFSVASKRVLGTLIEWRKHKDIFKFLLSFYLANDGLATLVYFTSIYAAVTLSMDPSEILILFLIIQAVGIPACIIGGRLADRVGCKPVLYGTLILWSLLSVLFAVSKDKTTFYFLSVVTGLVVGTTPAISRALLAKLTPLHKAAEIYGFNSVASRASSVMGPIVFGIISSYTGSQRLAMLSLLVFFLGSAVSLFFVSEPLERAA